MKCHITTLARQVFCALAFFACLLPEVFAQPDCTTGGFAGREIAVEGGGSVTVYGEDGTVLFPAPNFPPPAQSQSGDCDLWFELNAPLGPVQGSFPNTFGLCRNLDSTYCSQNGTREVLVFEFDGAALLPATQYYTFHPGSVAGSNNFYIAYGWGSGGQDSPDAYFKRVGTRMNVGMTATGDVNDWINDAFTSDRWVLPYEIEHACMSLPCKPTTDTSPFVSPMATLPNPSVTPTFTFSGDADVRVPSGESLDWNTPGLTLQFPAATQLIIEGELDAVGVTLTAADPLDGWNGIRFEPGSSGSLSTAGLEETVVSQVNGLGTASVYVHDAEVTLDGVRLDGRPQGLDQDAIVSGLHATGSKTIVSLFGSSVTEHTWNAIRVTSGAFVYASGNTITGSTNGFNVRGPYGGAHLFLWENTGEAGATAQSYGTVWLGPPDFGYVPDLPNNTLNFGSTGPALSAFNNGVVYAGVSVGDFATNNFLLRDDNTIGYVRSRYTSDIAARDNWWADPSGPDLASTVVDGSSTFDYCPWIIDPVTGALSSCGGGLELRTGSDAEARSGSQTSAGHGGQPPIPPGVAGLLWRARDHFGNGRYAAAMALLRRIAAEAGGGDEDRAIHRRALLLTAALTPWLDVGEAAQALSFLEAQAVPEAPERPWALRAIAQTHAAAGRDDDALAAAEMVELLGEEHVFFGLIHGALALGSLGDFPAAEARLTEADVQAAGNDDLIREIALARAELAAWSNTPFEGDLAAFGSEYQSANMAFVGTGIHEQPSNVLFGAVYPNPARGAVAIPLSLAELSSVRISAYDVLGREVMLIHNGQLSEGAYELQLDTASLAPGTYIVRASVRSGTSEQTFVRRLTIIH